MGSDDDSDVVRRMSELRVQLRFARLAAREDPDPQVRERAMWFARDVIWVLKQLTGRTQGIAVGALFRLGRTRGTGGAVPGLAAVPTVTNSGVCALQRYKPSR